MGSKRYSVAHTPRNTTSVTGEPSSLTTSFPIGKKQRPVRNQNSLDADEEHTGDTEWFGRPMNSMTLPKMTGSRNLRRPQEFGSSTSCLDRPLMPLESHNNTDIREFLRPHGNLPQSTSLESISKSSSFPNVSCSLKSIGSIQENLNSLDNGLLPALSSPISGQSSTRQSRRMKSRKQAVADDQESTISMNHSRSSFYSKGSAPSRARASSTGSEAIPTTERARTRTTDLEISTMFATYSDPINASSRPRLPPKVPIQPLADMATVKPRLNRRRTTDRAQRTKSSHLPLEHIPQGYQLHRVSLSLAITTSDIIEAMGKLDMQLNSLQWGYPISASCFEAFSLEISDHTLETWATRLDNMLQKFDTQLDNETALATLEQGIKKALDGRKTDKDEMDLDLGEQIGCIAQPNLEGAMDGLDQVRTWAKAAKASPEALQLDTPANQPTLNGDLSRIKRTGDDSDEFDGSDFDDEEILMHA